MLDNLAAAPVRLETPRVVEAQGVTHRARPSPRSGLQLPVVFEATWDA